MKKKYIIIIADKNDADYVKEVTEITDVQIEKIKPVIHEIKHNPIYLDGNWVTQKCIEPTPQKVYVESGVLSQHQVNLFDSFVPTGDENYPGVHTIESVMIVEEVEVLFKN